MACRAFDFTTLNREDVPGSGGAAWVTTDLTVVAPLPVLTMRGKVLVLMDGGLGCTADIHFEYSVDAGASWQEYGLVKFANPVFAATPILGWYESDFVLPAPGIHILRNRVVYAGSDYYSNSITVTVDPPFVEEQSAVGGFSEESVATGAFSEESAATGGMVEESAATGAMSEESAASGGFTEEV